jgi:cytochrome P450
MDPRCFLYWLPTERNRRNADAQLVLRTALDKIVADKRAAMSAASACASGAGGGGGGEEAEPEAQAEAEARAEEEAAGVHCDFLRVMLTARDRSGKDSKGTGKHSGALHVSDEALVDNLITLLFGGYDAAYLYSLINMTVICQFLFSPRMLFS